MIQLKPCRWEDVQHYFVDFQKKSKRFDLPSVTAQIIGIFDDKEFAGYFFIQGYDHTDVEITHGYLKTKYRHKNLPKQCMSLLEQMCRESGYKHMVLATGSRFNAYLKFAKGLGYTPQHLEFSKEL
jgi:GNAT superfamily N-acetyltransferase